MKEDSSNREQQREKSPAAWGTGGWTDRPRGIPWAHQYPKAKKAEVNTLGFPLKIKGRSLHNGQYWMTRKMWYVCIMQYYLEIKRHAIYKMDEPWTHKVKTPNTKGQTYIALYIKYTERSHSNRKELPAPREGKSGAVTLMGEHLYECTKPTDLCTFKVWIWRLYEIISLKQPPSNNNKNPSSLEG